MKIILINWRIIPEKEPEFLTDWKEKFTLGDAPGLIGEFLSKVEPNGFGQMVTWEMEPDIKDSDPPSMEYLSYVNVGIWDKLESFQAAVKNYAVEGRVLGDNDYEALPRRRAVVSPEHWRVGIGKLYETNSPGVEA